MMITQQDHLHVLMVDQKHTRRNEYKYRKLRHDGNKSIRTSWTMRKAVGLEGLSFCYNQIGSNVKERE